MTDSLSRRPIGDGSTSMGVRSLASGARGTTQGDSSMAVAKKAAKKPAKAAAKKPVKAAKKKK